MNGVDLQLSHPDTFYESINYIIQETDMEPAFHTFQDFITHTKGIAYLLIGVALIVLPLFWRFLTGKDNKTKTF